MTQLYSYIIEEFKSRLSLRVNNVRRTIRKEWSLLSKYQKFYLILEAPIAMYISFVLHRTLTSFLLYSIKYYILLVVFTLLFWGIISYIVDVIVIAKIKRELEEYLQEKQYNLLYDMLMYSDRAKDKTMFSTWTEDSKDRYTDCKSLIYNITYGCDCEQLLKDIDGLYDLYIERIRKTVKGTKKRKLFAELFPERGK